MKTRIIIFVFCLVTLNIMGQKTITHKKATASKSTTSANRAKKTVSPTKKSTQKSSVNLQAEISKLLSNMVYVQGGTFMMGATSEQGSDAAVAEKPAHRVTLSSFYIGRTEVTQALWKAVMGSNPSKFKGDNLPVEEVSWNDCQTFINKLNSFTGKNFRLPTEAEWEFAARGGTKSRGYKYSGSNYISDVAWYTDNSDDKTHPVGTKQANELGIYDMSGNVEEWCQDWDEYYNSNSQFNPIGSYSELGNRACRGGRYFEIARLCRTSQRDSFSPNYRLDSLGFRLALSE